MTTIANDRLAALDKAMLLSQLFNEDNFKAATNALNKPGNAGQAEFQDLCDKIPGLKMHKAWLWKNLKQAVDDQRQAGGVTTGW